MLTGIALRDGGGRVTGGWLHPCLKPGFAAPGLSGAISGISVAFVERAFASRAALHAASSKNSSPKPWSVGW